MIAVVLDNCTHRAKPASYDSSNLASTRPLFSSDQQTFVVGWSVIRSILLAKHVVWPDNSCQPGVIKPIVERAAAGDLRNHLSDPKFGKRASSFRDLALNWPKTTTSAKLSQP
jgi:hypothetical protein